MLAHAAPAMGRREAGRRRGSCCGTSLAGRRRARNTYSWLSSTNGSRTCSVPALSVVVVQPAGLLRYHAEQQAGPLDSTARFDRAWIQATLPVLDEVSGRSVPVRLDLRWSLVGELQRETVHSHVRVPQGAIVNSHSQTLTGDSVVSGMVAIGSDVLTFGPTGGAHVQQVKYGCQVVAHPHGDADLSC
jgi:hypothetical protein